MEEFTFNGGLITDVHETDLQPNQTPNVANILYNTSGSAKTRMGYLRYNGNPIGTAADQSNTGASVGTSSLGTYLYRTAQTFQPSGAISVTQVDVYLKMTNSGDQQFIKVELWSTSAGAPSALLTNGEAQILQVTGTSETAYSFRFRKPVSLLAGTTYAIVIKPFTRGSSSSVNLCEVAYRGATYANGSMYTSTDGGVTWAASASNDIRFVVYSGGDTGSTGLLRFYGTSSSVQQLLAKFGSVYYRGDDITGATTAITMANGITPSATDYIDYTTVNGTLLVVDNSNYILKYRGSTNAAYTTGTISTTYGSTAITGSGTLWATTTNAEVGEYIKLPDSKWYRITAIANNTSLTIEIAYDGSTTSAQAYTISPWGVVQGRFNDGATVPSSELIASLVKPQPQFIENHFNRVWTLTNNELRFSALDTSITGENFNDWDTGNNAGEIIIPSGEGDTGTGLYSLNGYLYVFQKHAIWELIGTSPSNFELRNISNEIGMISKRTLVEYDRYIYFFSGKDIYVFDGVNLRNITTGKVRQLIAGWANNTSPSAVLWDDKYMISYTESGTTSNNSILYYDIVRDIFGRHTNINASAWNVWDGGSDNNEVLFASSNQGSIYKWATVAHDDGYKIDTLYDTPSFGFAAGINDKTLKRFFVQQIARGDFNESVTMYTNISEITTAGTAINLSPGTSSLWDVAQWDVDVWSGDGAIITTRIAEFQGLGKYFKVRFEQSGYSEGIEIIGINGTARIRRLN